jgi:hypothetical protein
MKCTVTPGNVAIGAWIGGAGLTGGDAVHTFDYVAIGVLVALALWAGALLYRGKM